MTLKERGIPSVEMARAMFGLIRPYYKEGKRRIKDATRSPRRKDKPKGEDPTLKEATFEVVKDAVAHVSGNGWMVYGARRLFYRVRDLIQAITSKRFHPEKGYKYFKELLIEYQEIHGPLEGLYYDPRGRLHEPHSGQTVDLGTLEVAAYEFPHWVYDKILYVEKEGHWPLLKQARLAERYDMAIITGKGFATEAARKLLERAERSKDYQIFVLHDADPAGYNIARTLREETRRMPGYSVDVIDLGLTIEDALGMSLDPEEFVRQNKLPAELFASLNEVEKEYFIGKQKGPKSWLCKRVELDAMTAPQEVEYIECKLKEKGVRGKLIPPKDELPKLAAKIYRDKHAQWVDEALDDLISLDDIKKYLADEFEDEFELKHAEHYIEKGFKQDATLSWRAALKNELSAIQKGHVDALKDALRQRITEEAKGGD